MGKKGQGSGGHIEVQSRVGMMDSRVQPMGHHRVEVEDYMGQES